MAIVIRCFVIAKGLWSFKNHRLDKCGFIDIYGSFACFQENASTRMDWANAKPFDAIPGPKMWTLVSRHLPGGKIWVIWVKNAVFFGM